MANTNAFIQNTLLNENNSLSDLLDSMGIHYNKENESAIIEHSKDYDDVEFKNASQRFESEISILSINCQSINAKFDKLKLFLDSW